jgi:drug/metabolite transporter (DMT)-like permease
VLRALQAAGRRADAALRAAPGRALPACRAARGSPPVAAAAEPAAAGGANNNLSPSGAAAARIEPARGPRLAPTPALTRARSPPRPPPPRAAARLMLALVPLCWGTYNPSLRFLYSQPHAPGPGELSATRLVIALLPFVPTLFEIARGAAAQKADDAPAADGTDWRLVLRAAAELGTYNFLGTACQAWGLQHTSAVHAGVLLSSINVLVPLGAALSGDALRPVTWAACGLVLCGITVLNSGGGVGDLLGGGADVSLALSAGDAVVLCSAVCYSTYTVRLGAFARRLPALPLSAGKTAVLAAGCAAWALAEGAGGWQRPPGTGSVLWGGEGEPVAARAATWAAVAYSALVPGAAATWLQARGQSGVSAAEAQVILALTPVVSVIIAGAVLGEEVGANVYEGGAIMVAASLMCVAADVARDWKRA